MEGDVLMTGVPMSVLFAVAGVILGGVFGLLRWFAGRLLSDIESRIARIDEIDRRVSVRVDTIEDRFERMLAELPLHYQRRDDAIREYTAINAKLDRLYEVIMEEKRRGG